MIRIFSFVGSLAGEKSGTARYSDRLAQAVRETAAKAGEGVSYERITGDQIRVAYCRSCQSCFRTGFCPLDQKDDMAMLKAKILESDLLFFGSPVYMNSMSGITKSVIDRLAYWAHRYELAGKPAAVFTTTDNSAGQETALQLVEMLSYTGLVVVHAGYARRGMSQRPNLYLEEDMRPVCDEAAVKLLEALQSPSSFLTERDELKFQVRKRLARRGLKMAEITGIPTWKECYVLQERGVTDAGTYADYLRQHIEGER